MRVFRMALGLTLVLAVSACNEAGNGPGAQTYLKEIDRGLLQQQQNEKLDRAAISGAALNTAIADFVSNPTIEQREICQQRWTEAHEDYLASTVLQATNEITRAKVDSWPIQIGFVDSLPMYPDSGIISDLALEISRELIRSQHQITADEEAATGFHVIQHYLFVRDIAEFSAPTPRAQRRRAYLKLAAQLLKEDLDEYAADPDNDNIGLMPETYAELVSVLHQKTQELFLESNQLSQQPTSDRTILAVPRTARDIEIQFRAIAATLDSPVSLHAHLAELDADAARIFSETLTELTTLLSTPESLDDESISRVLLLISSLSHQLDDFEQLSAS